MCVCVLSRSMEICDIIIFAWWMMSSNKSVDDNLHVEGKKKKKKKPVIIISLLNLLFPQVSSEQAKMCVYEWICGLHEIVRCQ